MMWPEFERPTHDGKVFSSRASRGAWVVMFFYPKDFTPGCTAQSCAFRDAFSDLNRLGAKVVGVSGDDEVSHQKFADRHALPYPLISDGDGSLRKLLGVPRSLFGLFPGRVSYVIDPAGVCRLVFSSQLAAQAHAKRAVELIEGAGNG
jgi:thioredoxin-dependent peroxiredoxin